MSMINKIIVCNSITHLLKEDVGNYVVVCGSHGGLASAAYVIESRICKGVILNDAGVGKNGAGIASLEILNGCGIFAACVDKDTACIGKGIDTLNGIISHANEIAKDIGLHQGQKARVAADLMATTSLKKSQKKYYKKLNNIETIIYSSENEVRIVALDSNSMVRAEHRKAVVMTGSHGGLVGDKPAVPHPVIGAFYNDAGVGKNQAGISRLPWLQDHNIFGATVDANTASIGLGMDTYECGIISYVNDLALRIGIEPGMKAKVAAKLIVKKYDLTGNKII